MTVAEVASQRFPFAVPRYQRAYAWNDEAVADFIRDVEDMLEHEAGQTSHFFGGVVCIQLSDHQKVRPTSYEVVDGQQRLATLMLALSCVAKIADDLIGRSEKVDLRVAASARTLRDEIVENSLTWKDSDVAAGTSTIRRRMQLSLADDEVFEALIMRYEKLPKPTRESHILLIKAHAALMGMAEKFVGSKGKFTDRLSKLIRLRQALLDDAHVIHIVSKERTQAYRLFSVLNHRGQSLSEADLLRSRSLELLEGYVTEQEAAALLWDELLAHPAHDIDRFFQAIYPSVTGKRAKGDLFKVLETQFLPRAPETVKDAQQVVNQVEWFRNEFLVYVKLSRGTWPFDRQSSGPQQVSQWQTERLRRLTVTLRHDLALPLLLAGARCLSEKDFAALVYMLEIFAFRYKIICGAHATRPSNVYYEQSRLMRETEANGKPYTLKAIKAELQILIRDYAGDSLFKQLLLEKLRYSNSSQRVNIREFLTVMEDHRSWLAKPASKQPGAKPKPSMTKVIDLDEATIEHVYPQHSSTTSADNELEPIKHWLANLTFFGPSDNSNTGNKPFSVKRTSSYAKSDIGLTADLAALTAWTKTEFDAREAELLEQAIRVFVI